MKTALKEYRLRIGLTQVQVADKASISERIYQKYESGDSKQRCVPNVLTAIKIADALGVRDLRELWRT